jgi:hypothetical protein
LEAGLCDDGGDGLLLLGERERLDGAGEILDCIELVVAGDDGDSDGIDVWIEQVSAVMGGVHPEVVEEDGGGGFSYVFGDEAEVNAGVGAAFCELGLAGKLVGDVGVVGHLAGVEGGGLGEDGVEAKWRKSLIGAVLVGCGEEILLGDGERDFGLGIVIGCEGRSECPKEERGERKGESSRLEGGRGL